MQFYLWQNKTYFRRNIYSITGKMSAGLFSKALKGAGFSVTTSKDGIRSFRNEHDDRMGEPSRGGKAPRGSWRGGRGNWRSSSRGRRGYRGRGGPRGRGRGQRYQYSGGESQEEVDGDDIVMGDFETDKSYKRYTPYGGRAYRQPDNKFRSSKSQGYQSGETWNKISIPNGRNHDKDWLLKRLQNSCEVSFQPVEFHYFNNNAVFFVNEQCSADALRALSGSITVKDGSRLFVQVHQSGPPKFTNSASTDSTSIDQDVLKQSLNTRYDSTTHSLDLSNFYHDKVLNENNIQAVLSRPLLLGLIVKLIKEFCPQLQNLDLRNNRISNLDVLKELQEAAPDISSLHLGENNIKHINELKKIKNLKKLKILVADGNPLCDNYQNSQTGYVSDIRSIFPKLVTLDNCELPTHIGFELPSSTSLPETKGSFIPDELTKKLVLPFVKQYFDVYDSENRQKLLDAYDDEAVFSMCVADHRKERGNGSGPLNVYRKHSRNMKFLHDAARRLELLKMSRLSVVAFLNELPSTKHDLESLTVDVNFVQPTCIGFTVCGVFKEGDVQELRAFTRTFVAVPASAGNSIAIINDQLTIRNPSKTQRELSYKSSGFPVAVSVPSTSTPSPSPVAALGVQQQQMVEQFSKHSRMNINWSYKALSENNWDYKKAAEIFQSLNAQGSIPQEAFAK